MTDLHALGQVRLDNEALQFTGPKTSHCFGVPYVTLGIAGVMEEGSDMEWESTMKAAHARFMEALNDYTKDATQIAWRLYPETRWTDDGMYTVKCRLAVWK